jgi:hypothetical protein
MWSNLELLEKFAETLKKSKKSVIFYLYISKEAG